MARGTKTFRLESTWPLLKEAADLLRRRAPAHILAPVLERLDREVDALPAPRAPGFVPWPEPYPGASAFADLEARRLAAYEAFRDEYEDLLANRVGERGRKYEALAKLHLECSNQGYRFGWVQTIPHRRRPAPRRPKKLALARSPADETWERLAP